MVIQKRVVFLLLAGLAGAQGSEVFTGVITDTMCGARHGMMKDQTDEQCIRMCVKGSSQYALFDGKNVLKLSNQKLPAKFAARRVKVTGAYDSKNHTIKVESIEPAEP